MVQRECKATETTGQSSATRSLPDLCSLQNHTKGGLWAALEIEASIPPIHIQLKQQITRCAIRFNKLGSTNPIMQRLPDTWREGLKPTAPPPLPPKLYNHSAADSRRTSPLLDIAADRSVPNSSMAKDNNELWPSCKELISELTKSNQNLLVYSDGSLIKKSGFSRTGAAAVVYHEGREINSEKMGIGERAEVYDAEMAGLMMGARMAVKYARSHPQINNIYFFADNTAGVRAIFNPKPRTGQLYAARFHKKICHFLDENPEHQMSVSWCPGHTNIKGNERADELAKEATTLQWNAPIGTTRAHAIRWAKLSSERLWTREWKAAAQAGAGPRPWEAVTDGSGFKYREPEPAKAGPKPRLSGRAGPGNHYLPTILGTRSGIQALTTFLQKSCAFTMNGQRPEERTPPLFDEEPEVSESDDDDP
ncbi:unnamed protein product [Cyclocybe aegerita]|uniref:ribonuclease H n=1 Tax=Cyclocybe aegerita TaxID=1973307 RepID=A0A8S0WQ25_CYCAE|nr:unnamed protein product [Cyclocybe aegerita]